MTGCYKLFCFLQSCIPVHCSSSNTPKPQLLRVLVVFLCAVLLFPLAVGRALLLAQEIAKFPEKCLISDRCSAYHAAYEAESMEQALNFEMEQGMEIIRTESATGKFLAS